MKSNWNYPTTVWVGENRIDDLYLACKNLKINSPLFVTDKDALIEKKLHKTNREITAAFVRMVGDAVEPKIVSLDEALKIARDLELDLVEISPNAEPPVCKVIDYRKFIYDQKKKQRTIKNKAQKIVVKELRFGPNTGEHDFKFKLNHAMNFLADGAKVKAFVFFRGRSIIFKEQGQILLLRLAQALEDVGVVEEMPKLDGKKMIMIIAPKKKN